MPWSLGSVARQMIALERGFGKECQENTAGTDLEENVTACFLGDDREAQDRPIEGFGFVQVVNISPRQT